MTLQAFRDGSLQCLVATDVAARGLDIKGIELVVQVRERVTSSAVRVG
jgi:superfamily II DNA/RNA helicase